MKILATFPSKSNPGKLYHVIEPEAGGEPYCDCWQWKKHRTCKHLLTYRSMQLYRTNGVPLKGHSLPELTFDQEIEDMVKSLNKIP